MRVAIIGANGAIGNALYEKIQSLPTTVSVARLGRARHDDAIDIHIDLSDETTFEQAAAELAEVGPLDMVLVTAGTLHNDTVVPEKSLRQIDPANMHHLFQVNTVLPALSLKHFYPLLKRDTRTVFACLSAKIGSISDNKIGGWHSYRMSKAALNMLIRNAAIEAARSKPNAIIIGLHPGTVDSALSRPFQKNLPPNQLKSPTVCADQLWGVLTALDSNDNGCLIDYQGNHIAP